MAPKAIMSATANIDAACAEVALTEKKTMFVSGFCTTRVT
jgi:hypothetical protein